MSATVTHPTTEVLLACRVCEQHHVILVTLASEGCPADCRHGEPHELPIVDFAMPPRCTRCDSALNGLVNQLTVEYTALEQFAEAGEAGR